MRRPLPIRTDCLPVVETRFGRLYQADCMEVLPGIETESVDVVFTDPPFNLGKDYGELVSDKQSTRDYLQWCRRWLRECVRTLSAGGSFFAYHLPKWNIRIAGFLQELGLTFRHWIAVEQAGRLPIPGQLYPAHYALLYFSKGQPKTFRRLRTPIEQCRHCGGEIKDYDGHRAAMNADGVTLKDIWTDIPPVRHPTFKPPSRHANSVSTKLLERVVEMSSEPGDIVLDPFGGKRHHVRRVRAARAGVDRHRDRGCRPDHRTPKRWCGASLEYGLGGPTPRMSRSSSEWQAPGRRGGSTPPGVGVQRADAWVEHRRRRTPRRTVPTVRSRRGTRSSATTLAARGESCRRAEPGEAGRTGIFSLLPHVRMHVDGQGNGPDASPRARRRSRGRFPAGSSISHQREIGLLRH